MDWNCAPLFKRRAMLRPVARGFCRWPARIAPSARHRLTAVCDARTRCWWGPCRPSEPLVCPRARAAGCAPPAGSVGVQKATWQYGQTDCTGGGAACPGVSQMSHSHYPALARTARPCAISTGGPWPDRRERSHRRAPARDAPSAGRGGRTLATHACPISGSPAHLFIASVAFYVGQSH